jgi:hypothetical protein
MIYRVERKENPFVQVDKGFINDTNIGYKEKGILLYFLSKPDGWKFYEGEIQAHSHDGLTAVRTGIQSLIKAGYIERRMLKGSGGKFAGYEYVVHETSEKCKAADEEKPFSENLKTDNPKMENPISENLTLINNEDSKNDGTNNEVSKKADAPKTDPKDKFCGHTFSEPMQAVLTDWLTYKSERREGYKATGLKSFMTQAEHMAEKYEESDIIAIIGESMANNWKGICWDKLTGKEKPAEPVERPIPPEILRNNQQHEEMRRRLHSGQGDWKEALSE